MDESVDLKTVLKQHNLWLKNGRVGEGRANLTGADLTGAYLTGANGIIAIYVPGMSTRGDYLYAYNGPDGWTIKAGCHNVSPTEFRALVTDRPLYLLALDFIERAIEMQGESTNNGKVDRAGQ